MGMTVAIAPRSYRSGSADGQAIAALGVRLDFDAQGSKLLTELPDDNFGDALGFLDFVLVRGEAVDVQSDFAQGARNAGEPQIGKHVRFLGRHLGHRAARLGPMSMGVDDELRRPHILSTAGACR